MNSLDIVRKSKTAAIATDGEDRILAWNAPAREALGHDDASVIGLRLSRVFSPLDVFGNPLRYDGPLFFSLLEQGESVRNFECSLKKADGEYQRFSVSVVMVVGNGSNDSQLVHVLRRVQRRRAADAFLSRVLNGSEDGVGLGMGASLRVSESDESVLTSRQKEVLRLVADGLSTDEIGTALCISAETVRSHIRHALHRLGAHSRVEAVAAAYRRHLI